MPAGRARGLSLQPGRPLPGHTSPSVRLPAPPATCSCRLSGRDAEASAWGWGPWVIRALAQRARTSLAEHGPGDKRRRPRRAAASSLSYSMAMLGAYTAFPLLYKSSRKWARGPSGDPLDTIKMKMEAGRCWKEQISNLRSVVTGVSQKQVDLGLSREGNDTRVGLRGLMCVIVAWVRGGLQNRGPRHAAGGTDRRVPCRMSSEPGREGPLSGLCGAGARKETGPPDTQSLHFLPLRRSHSSPQPQPDPLF